MQKLYYIFFFLITIISCTAETKKDYNNEEKCTDDRSLNKSIIQDSIYYITPNVNLGRYEGYATLEEWKKNVREHSDVDCYMQLIIYYSEYPNDQDEMIELAEIMIKTKDKNEPYILDYYDYVKRSKKSNKIQLINRAIKYLKTISSRNDDIFSVQARSSLSELFNEGIWVKRDTIIADYLYNGGLKLDSIIQARQKMYLK